MAILITTILFGLVGLALAVGGGQLLALGGSIYYLITGIAFIVTAVLLYLRRSTALTLYALIVLGSLAWAIWEVGFDWWQLGPRGGVIILLGLWLLTPWIRKPLGFQSPTGARYPVGAAPLAASVALAILIAVISMFTDPYDVEGNCQRKLWRRPRPWAILFLRVSGTSMVARTTANAIRRSIRSMSRMSMNWRRSGGIRPAT